MLDAQLFPLPQLVVTQNIFCCIICSILKCLFRFGPYAAENTDVLCARCSTVSSTSADASLRKQTLVLCVRCLTVSSTSDHASLRTHKLCFIMCWMLNCFFNLRSCLTENTQTLLYCALDAQICLQPQLIVSLRKHTIVLCVRCSTEKTHCSLCARC